jgi:predicted transcriptional regulator YdeE
LWRRFFAEHIADAIPDPLPDAEIIAVYSEYEPDATGPYSYLPYSYLIGQQVRSAEQVPRGMSAVTIPAGRYLRFHVAGSTPADRAHTWEEIGRFFELSPEYERAWTADFEVHRRDDTEMYVAVK